MKITRYFGGGRLKLTEAEGELFASYFASCLRRGQSGEKVLGTILRYNRYSTEPICEILKALDTAGCWECGVASGICIWRSESSILQFHIISDCDHQIIYQNAVGMSDILKQDRQRGYESLARDFGTKRRLGPRFLDFP